MNAAEQEYVNEQIKSRGKHWFVNSPGLNASKPAMDSVSTTVNDDKKEWGNLISKLLSVRSKRQSKPAIATDHKAHKAADKLAVLVSMKPSTRATAFEREARGERVGLNDKLVELRERLEIPEGQEQQQRDDIKDFWSKQHERNTLNIDLML